MCLFRPLNPLARTERHAAATTDLRLGMSKKQVFAVSCVAAIPAIGLLVMLVLNALSHGGQMFSGAMTVFVGLTALLCLFGVGALPIYILAFYPAEGFLPTAPPPQTSPPPSDDDDDEEDLAGGDDEFEDDDEFGEAGGFEDDEFGDDGFDDDGFDDDFDDDDEWN